jgi:hypothetical protein
MYNIAHKQCGPSSRAYSTAHQQWAAVQQSSLVVYTQYVQHRAQTVRAKLTRVQHRSPTVGCGAAEQPSGLYAVSRTSRAGQAHARTSKVHIKAHQQCGPRSRVYPPSSLVFYTQYRAQTVRAKLTRVQHRSQTVVRATLNGAHQSSPTVRTLKGASPEQPTRRAENPEAPGSTRGVHQSSPTVRATLNGAPPEQRSGLYAGSRIRRFLVRDPLGSDTPGGALEVRP